MTVCEEKYFGSTSAKSLTFNSKPGTYYIRIYNKNGSTGTYTLKYKEEPIATAPAATTPAVEPTQPAADTSTGMPTTPVNDTSNTIVTPAEPVTKPTIPASQAKLTVDTNTITASADGTLSKAAVLVDSGGEGFVADTGGTSWLKAGSSSSSASASGRESFSSNGNVYLFVEKNTGSSSRTGTVTLTHSNGTLVQRVTVRQDAMAAVLTVDKTEITASAAGTLSKSFVTVTADERGFAADTGSSTWIKVSSTDSSSSASGKVSLSGSGKLYLFVEQNTKSTARTGTVTLTHNDGKLKKEITVRQDGLNAVLNVNTAEKTANRLGVFYDNKVTVNTQKTGGYTVEVKDSSWLWAAQENTTDTTAGMSKLTLEDGQEFYLVAAENTGSKRSCEVVITHALGELTKTFTVTQKGTEGAYLETDRETAYFDEPRAAVSGAVSVTANDDLRWTVNTSDSWIQLVEIESTEAEKHVSLEKTGSANFYIYVEENGTYEPRTGTVTISAPGLEPKEIYVSQDENERDLKSLLEELTVSVTRKTFNKGKTSKIRFVFPKDLYASDVASVQYSSSKKKVVTVSRDGVITAKRMGKADIKVKVTLENRASKVFRLKVTIGKRKVTVTKK